MSKKNYHVSFRNDIDMWQVKAEHAERASALTRTNAQAMERGRELASAAGGELIPHRKSDGEITNPNSYGRDPNPPKDKKH